MAGVKVKIGKKAYTLKFGYGVLRRLAQHYNQKTFSEFGAYIDGLNLTSNDIGFDALNFIGELVVSAASYSVKSDVPFDSDDVIQEFVLENGVTDDLTKVIEAFFNSFAKLSENEGKQNPAKPKK